jgi:hypothetical protein
MNNVLTDKVPRLNPNGTMYTQLKTIESRHVKQVMLKGGPQWKRKGKMKNVTRVNVCCTLFLYDLDKYSRKYQRYIKQLEPIPVDIDAKSDSMITMCIYNTLG